MTQHPTPTHGCQGRTGSDAVRTHDSEGAQRLHSGAVSRQVVERSGEAARTGADSASRLLHSIAHPMAHKPLHALPSGRNSDLQLAVEAVDLHPQP